MLSGEMYPYFLLSLRKPCMVVPHTGQVPRMACRPFFMVTFLGSFISRFVLHLTQYASAIVLVSFHNVYSAR